MAPTISRPGKPAASLRKKRNHDSKIQKRRALDKDAKVTRVDANITTQCPTPEPSPTGRPAAALRKKTKVKHEKRHRSEHTARVTKPDPRQRVARRLSSSSTAPVVSFETTRLATEAPSSETRTPDTAGANDENAIVVSAIGKPGPRKRKSHTPQAYVTKVRSELSPPELQPSRVSFGNQGRTSCESHHLETPEQNTSELSANAENIVVSAVGKPGPKKRESVATSAQAIKATCQSHHQKLSSTPTDKSVPSTTERNAKTVATPALSHDRNVRPRLLDRQDNAVRISTDMFEDSQQGATIIHTSSKAAGLKAQRQDVHLKPQGATVKLTATTDRPPANAKGPSAAATIPFVKPEPKAQKQDVRTSKPQGGTVDHPITIYTPPSSAHASTPVVPSKPAPEVQKDKASLARETARSNAASNATEKQKASEARLKRLQGKSHFASPTKKPFTAASQTKSAATNQDRITKPAARVPPAKKTYIPKYNFKAREARRTRRYQASQLECEGRRWCRFYKAG